MKIKDILASVGLPNTAAGKAAFYKKYETEDDYFKAMGGYMKHGGPMDAVNSWAPDFLNLPALGHGGMPCMNCGGYMDEGGGLNRSEDYGSKKHPYASVASDDFAGGGRSYPIPTRADAVDALRLAGLHGRGDVKAKVYAKYPDLKKVDGGTMSADLEGMYPSFGTGGADLSMSDFRKYLERVKKEGGPSFPGEGEQDIIGKRKNEVLKEISDNFDTHAMNEVYKQNQGEFAGGGFQDNGMNALMAFLGQRGQGDGYDYVPYNQRGYGLGKKDFKRFSQLPASTQYQGISKINYGLAGRVFPRLFGPKSIEFNTRNAYEDNMKMQPTDEASIRKMMKMKGKQKTSSYGDGQGPYPETEESTQQPDKQNGFQRNFGKTPQSNSSMYEPSDLPQGIRASQAKEMGDVNSPINMNPYHNTTDNNPVYQQFGFDNTPKAGPRNTFGYGGGYARYDVGGPGPATYGYNMIGPATAADQWKADALNEDTTLQPKGTPASLFQNYLNTDPQIQQQKADANLLRDPNTNKPYQDNTFKLKKDPWGEQEAIALNSLGRGATSLINNTSNQRILNERKAHSTFGTGDANQAAVDDRGDYSKMAGQANGMLRYDQMLPVQYTGQSFKNDSLVKYGGDPFYDNSFLKGGGSAPSANFWTASQINKAAQAFEYSEPDIDVNHSLSAVEPEEANLEAEGGETTIVDVKGIPSLFDIKGPRHTGGGVPLNLPEDSFVFSDTKAMMIKGGDILAQFGMSPKKSGYTPAEISKKVTGGKYDMNYYRGVLADKDSDPMRRETAEMMIANYNLKLAKLGLVQESKKGFPQGIPKIAEPWMTSMKMNPADLLQTQGQQEQPDGDMTAKYGGRLPKAQVGVGSVQAIIDAKNKIHKSNIEDDQKNYLAAEEDYAQTRESNELRDLYKKAQERVAAGDIEPFMDWLPFNTPSAETYLESFKNKAKLYKQDPNALITQYENLKTPVKVVAKPVAKIITNAKGIDVANAHLPAETITPNLSDTVYNKVDVQKMDDKAYAAFDARMRADIKAGRKVTSKEEGGELFMAQDGLAGLDEEKRRRAALANKVPVTVAPYGKDQDVIDFFKQNKIKGSGDLYDKRIGRQSKEAIGYGKDVPYSEWATGNPGFLKSKADFDPNKEADLIEYEKFHKKDTYDKTYNQIMKKNPNMDPSKARDLATKVSEQLSFIDTKGDVRDADKKWGNYHRSRKELQFEEDPAVGPIVQKKNDQYVPIKPGAPIVNNQMQGTAPWWLQDQVTLGQDAVNFFGVKKRNPWQMKPQYAGYNPTFYDPTRELAANAELANIGTQGLNAFTNPQAFNAGFSQIQGQGAKNAADIMARTNNANVAVANDFEVRNKNLMNDASVNNANASTNFYNDTVRGDQEFYNAKSLRLDNMANHYKNAITNKMNTANMNDLTDQYKVDPRGGGRIRWTNGKPIKPEAQSDHWDQMASAVKRLTENGQFTREEAIKIVTGQAGKDVASNMPYNPMEGSYPMRTAADVNDYES
jgi:hypothetical protein